jgi:hypothetical protein
MSDIPASIRTMRDMRVLVDGIGVVSAGELLNLGEIMLKRYGRADATEPPPAEPNPPPISADTDEPDKLDKASEVVAELNDRLEDAEQQDAMQQLEDYLTRLEDRSQRLEVEAIEAARKDNDVKALAALLGEPEGKPEPEPEPEPKAKEGE